MSRVPGLRWDCWPEPDDRLLLRAILHPDDREAAAAWSRVGPRLDLDAPTEERYRLYPLLAERLTAIAPDEPRLGMLAGVRRQATIQSLLRLRHLDAVLALLEEAGLEVVLLKGPALALSAYPDVGLRPFGDVDVLVEVTRHADAVAALVAAGWRPGAADFRGSHAANLVGESIDVDVHRTLNRELVVVGRPEAAWEHLRRQPADRALPGGRVPTVLAPAEALVHTVVHGTQWHAGPPVLRWVADAVHLARRPDLDWDRVVTTSRLFGAEAVVHDGLRLAEATAAVAVPERVTARLGAARGTPFSRLRTRSFHQRPRTDGRLGGLPQTVAVHLRRTRDLPLRGVLRAAPGFACEVWGVDRPSRLPVAVVRRALAR